jgi:hypothetical protein
MRKLILILLAFLAVFTVIRAFDEVEAAETAFSIEKTVEIVQ